MPLCWWAEHGGRVSAPASFSHLPGKKLELRADNTAKVSQPVAGELSPPAAAPALHIGKGKLCFHPPCTSVLSHLRVWPALPYLTSSFGSDRKRARATTDRRKNVWLSAKTKALGGALVSRHGSWGNLKVCMASPLPVPPVHEVQTLSAFSGSV